MDADELDALLEKVACPCCGHATLNDAGRRHVCSFCYREDDVESGWNERTLQQGCVNFLRIGVCGPNGAR